MNPSKNLAVSVHQKLLNKSRDENRVFNELLQYYAMERFLYRLGESAFTNQFVLKGAFVFRVMEMPPSRPTRDLDFLGFTENSVENIIAIVKDICDVPVPDDGLVFDPSSVIGKRINERAEYSGVQVTFLGFLGSARINMQLDIGFADVISPAPSKIDIPATLEKMATPVIYVYPPETIVAEKFQAMVDLGMMNSRLKDFYDLWFLSTTINFSFPVLADAIQQTFHHRRTELPSAIPPGLMPEFAAAKQVQWEALLKKNRLFNAPPELDEVLLHLKGFLGPFLGEKQDHPRRWIPNHGWN